MKNFIFDKRGIVLSEWMRIFLAVIGILILVALASKLIGIFAEKTDLEQAKASLDELVSKLNLLGEGDVGNNLVQNPEGWSLFFYGNKLYFCNVVQLGLNSDAGGDFAKACDKSGASVSLDYEVKINYNCPYFYFGKRSIVPNCLDLDNLPKKINFAKKEGVVNIIADEDFEGYQVLDSLIDFKRTDNFPSVRELLFNYSIEPSEKLKQQINSVVYDYILELNVGEQYGLSRGKLWWKFSFVMLDEDPSLNKKLLEFDNFEEGYYINKLLGSNSYRFSENGKDFIISLRFYNKDDAVLNVAAGP